MITIVNGKVTRNAMTAKLSVTADVVKMIVAGNDDNEDVRYHMVSGQVLPMLTITLPGGKQLVVEPWELEEIISCANSISRRFANNAIDATNPATVVI